MMLAVLRASCYTSACVLSSCCSTCEHLVPRSLPMHRHAREKRPRATNTCQQLLLRSEGCSASRRRTCARGRAGKAPVCLQENSQVLLCAQDSCFNIPHHTHIRCIKSVMIMKNMLTDNCKLFVGTSFTLCTHTAQRIQLKRETHFYIKSDLK